MPWRCRLHGDHPCNASSASRASHSTAALPGGGVAVHHRKPSRALQHIQRIRHQELRKLRHAAGQQAALTGPSAASHDASSTAHTGWHPLASAVTWKVEEEGAMFKTPLPQQLSPTWKVMLLSDGSVTRHLQLLTGQSIAVECLEMAGIGDDLRGLPAGADLIKGPRVQRQVFLRLPPAAENGATAGGKTLAYAASWWSADQVNEYLVDRQQPIWASLSATRTELYRDIQAVYYGHSPFLSREFEQAGPFWGRQYIFWHEGRPLTLIYEVFSPALQLMLGPAETV